MVLCELNEILDIVSIVIEAVILSIRNENKAILICIGIQLQKSKLIFPYFLAVNFVNYALLKLSGYVNDQVHRLCTCYEIEMENEVFL